MGCVVDSSAIMIDREEKGQMHDTNEASIGSLNITTQYDSLKGGPIEGCAEAKDNERQISDTHTEKFIWETPPKQSYRKFIYQQENFTCPYIYTDYQYVQQIHPIACDNQYYHISLNYNGVAENQVQYLPYKMYSQSYPHDVQLQEFQYFVVIDFEATCDKDMNPQPQEIIEFPSVLVNSATGQLEASFQTYVRPTYHQHLSDFCKELTGIQQIQVDRGVPLSEALLRHDKWLEDKGIKQKNFAVVTWSNWDCRVMLESECKVKRIRKPPYFNSWINLKVPFHEMFGDVRCNLKEAVQMAGLSWEGRAHCGLDDARNTARLLALLMQRGFKLSITNSLVWPSVQPMTQFFPDSYTDPTQPLPKKAKEIAAAHAMLYHPYMDPTPKENSVHYCYCGVLSSKCKIRKPGPYHGRCFYGCGNWTATRRAACSYFEWE